MTEGKYKCDLTKPVHSRCLPSPEGTNLEDCEKACFTEKEKSYATKLREAIKKKREVEMKETKGVIDIDKYIDAPLLDEARNQIKGHFKELNYEMLKPLLTCDESYTKIFEYVPNLCVLPSLLINFNADDIYGTLHLSLNVDDEKQLIIKYRNETSQRVIRKIMKNKLDEIKTNLDTWVANARRQHEKILNNPELVREYRFKPKDIKTAVDIIIVISYDILKRKTGHNPSIDELSQYITAPYEGAEKQYLETQKEVYQKLLGMNTEEAEKSALYVSLVKVSAQYGSTEDENELVRALIPFKLTSLSNQVKKCINEGKNVVIPLGLQIVSEGKILPESGHANMLVVRKIGDKKEVIRIEPHGYNSQIFGKYQIMDFLKPKLLFIKDGYQYIDTVLDVLGPQAFEAGELCDIGQKEQYAQQTYFPASGLCVLWSVYVTIVFMLNLNVPSRVIGNYLSFRDITNTVERSIKFSKRALATFLLLFWSVVKDMRSQKKQSDCEKETVKSFGAHSEFYRQLFPLYEKIDDKMKGGLVGGGKYYHKYLKYKNKYLNLKRKFDFPISST